MTRLQHSDAVGPLQEVFRPVLTALGRVVNQVSLNRTDDGELYELQVLLETLPLSTDQFGLACVRLQNAQRYLASQEQGAARWELNTLRQQLCVHLGAEGVPRPRRPVSGNR
ncbi:MAG: hypothetical protein GXX96_08060 [Planctomycetaceae bacterium]|nr:hypothetical protein [Planctomycetaceae bacterium]